LVVPRHVGDSEDLVVYPRSNAARLFDDAASIVIPHQGGDLTAMGVGYRILSQGEDRLYNRGRESIVDCSVLRLLVRELQLRIADYVLTVGPT